MRSADIENGRIQGKEIVVRPNGNLTLALATLSLSLPNVSLSFFFFFLQFKKNLLVGIQCSIERQVLTLQLRHDHPKWENMGNGKR